MSARHVFAFCCGLAVIPAVRLTAETEADPAWAAERWWRALSLHCGNAYAGTLVTDDAADAALAGRPLVMHVRTCGDTRIEIPFHVGEDRSRTWVLTRTATGLRLEHDHRHEDGGADEVTLYGGHTVEAGTESTQSFPADERSRELFAAHGIPQSAENVWSMEIVPGERFSYTLRRPGRHFQVDFDLSRPVEAPPPPWGHEAAGGR